MTPARTDGRKALAGLLDTALSTVVDAVYAYRVGDLAGQSPVVTVSSGGSDRPRLTARGGRSTNFYQIDVFVVYAVEGTAWGEDEAEDAVDAIEQLIAGVVTANQVTANWAALDFSEQSQRVDVAIGGVEYIREVIQLQAEVYA
jgi:hypothetical protein